MTDKSPDPLGRFDVIGHVRLPSPLPKTGPLPQITNVILGIDDDPALKWVEQITQRIGDWRAEFRSTYVRWSLTINGLHVASDLYSSPEWKRRRKEFVVSTRGPVDGRPLIVAQWDGDTAADAHIRSVPMVLAYGVIDLCALFEEVIFTAYRLYLNANRDALITGPDWKDLRRLRREAEEDPSKASAWEAAWLERLNSWHRKKLYDGLGPVLLAFCGRAGLKTPSTYTKTSPETWAESLDALMVLRNLLIHGEKVVPTKLAEASKKPHGLGFKFKVGDPLQVELVHLQAAHAFSEQLLTALNLSLIERAGVKLPAAAKSEVPPEAPNEHEVSGPD